MIEKAPVTRKQTLDKDLTKIIQVEQATSILSRNLIAPGLGLLFLAFAGILASFYVGANASMVIIVSAAAIGAYMALNIGANDVANNVGPAVGAKALTMTGALIIAAVFESSGALIAGGDVVDTISKGIIAPESVADPSNFVLAMMAALLSSALWVNLATWIGAPVSTTHAVVGGVVGAGIAAAGFSAVNWPLMGNIALSWVVSPVIGGIAAALVLAFIKTTIIYQDDKIASARRWLPLLIATMAASFSTYLVTKGLGNLVHLKGSALLAVAVTSFVVVWAISHVHVRKQSAGMQNRNQSLRKLFNIPLVISAALLSFAHGANDVANAVGPLAAIVAVAQSDNVSSHVEIPLWVMLIGAFGISLGLLLFGPKLIQMVGDQITKLNQMRAFCVALSAAVTVIVASWLGLPVSSTHTAIGAIFGVGFFREWYTANSKRRKTYLARRMTENGNHIEKDEKEERPLSAEEIVHRKLVRRAHVMTIAAAWVTTVPISAILSAFIFYVLRMVS